jgi:hypothetical protein
MKIAYAITERDGKSYFNRIGVSFDNKDGSINVLLDAFPVNGKIQLRDSEQSADDMPPSPKDGGSKRSK